MKKKIYCKHVRDGYNVKRGMFGKVYRSDMPTKYWAIKAFRLWELDKPLDDLYKEVPCVPFKIAD